MRRLIRQLAYFSDEIRGKVHQRYQAGELTRFAVGNALTSVARDTADPQTRWDLERLGAAVLADASLPQLTRLRSGDRSLDDRADKDKPGSRTPWWSARKTRA